MLHNDYSLFPHVDLRLFDGAAGTATGGAAGEGAAAAGNSGTEGETQNKVPGNTRRGKSGEYDHVRFGKQPAAAADADTTDPAAGDPAEGEGKDTAPGTLDEKEAKRKAFRDLVQGEYKDEYTEETQRIIDRRFKEAKQMEARLAAAQPLLDLLSQRYSITDGDIVKLTGAVEGDAALWQQASEEAGMTPDQYRELVQLRAMRDRADAAERQSITRQLANQKMRQWQSEAEALQAKYPNFNLGAELQNQQFVNMLKANTPMEHAYRVLHFDELLAEAQQQTERKITSNIRAKGARPAENGKTPQSASIVKDDVTKLTKKDRAEIARLAAQGKIIQF